MSGTGEPGAAAAEPAEERTAASERPVRVLVVDDDPFVRRAVGGVVSDDPGLDLAASCASGEEALAWLGEPGNRADVVLTDLQMPGRDGVATTSALRALQDPPQVVVLTVSSDQAQVRAALRAGAAGYLVKSAPPREIVAAVRRAHAGESVLSPEVTRGVVEGFLEGAPAPTAADAWRDALTPREAQIALAVARGLSNQEIAAELGTTLPTIKTTVSRILTKLGLENRVQVALRVHGL
ncbi:response regulator [Nigerium massiliense]|uniref:response regulator n=1 Tax=Nigerium massiliense TaxID=1522317 RepID=UPI0006945DD8|nr:response regulator transcription factor [Nigerium massiliense]